MFKPTNLLIIDDEPAIVKVFEKLAKDEGWTFASASSGTQAIDMLNKSAFEAAVVDIALPGFTGMQILEYVKQNQISTEMLIMTGVGSVETAVQAIKLGAYDYFTKPFDDINKISNAIAKAMERHRLLQKLKQMERMEGDSSSYEGIIGKSRKMQEVFELIESVAPTNSTVLVLGESGTGKELVAQALHKRSRRAGKPFIVINCAAVPETLLESELFGHRRGSFTGAIQDKKGLFEEADGGTIFMDEVGDIPPAIQVKLLRVLQEGEVRMIGDNSSKNVDVRIIAATNRDLTQLVGENKFREDLYYRLNVISITVPPLRERSDDIPLLTYYFLQKNAKKSGKEIATCSVDAITALQHYKWVGNVRELENVVERACVLVNGPVIQARDLPQRVLGESFYLTKEDGHSDFSKFSYHEAKEKAFMTFNRSYLSSLMRSSKGNISFAAAKAGMDRSNFKKILKKCSLNAEEFKKSK
ncbi:MAG: sigma-54-dependent Fis family transcriptional regulator [Deltaproteobacteria bacterium]|nr:sigma-54-dependent Fis family transcriptional regulator [Deltaproteobacteria bacterium]MBI2342120.1 sigma-54-dependent Fis family transcriptional regulator [Deltaproteobacteria bacterium]MBI2974229.1 sigma-54-dependent Fis family transcriptional regulator [Deltaproteobacteria bacterium]